MTKKLYRIIPLLLVLVLVMGIIPANAQDDPIVVTWFIGLGTGNDPLQIPTEEAVVEAWNDSHDDIKIEMIIAPTFEDGRNMMSTLMATGDAPDIVGPIGFGGSNDYKDNWLDLQPLVDSSGYDLSQFPQGAVDAQRTEDGLLGLPLASFPTFLWYRPALFDEAGLEYPPAAYGEPYILDGEEVEWNLETLREVGMILTVDANGYDATEAEFDPENTIQWGYNNQWVDSRQHGTLCGGGSMYETLEDGTYNAVFPDNWVDCWTWYYNGMWEDHFIPTNAQDGSDLLAAGNAFSSGNLAMSQTHLWYVCCLEDSEWDAAALPSYNGVVTSRLHADTFRVMNTTEHPEATFEVLAYLTGEASVPLLVVYGGFPTRAEDQATWLDLQDEKFTQGVNWDIAIDGLNYPDLPSHEEWLPNSIKANVRINAFRSLVETTPDLDIDTEIEILLADLTAIYNEEAE